MFNRSDSSSSKHKSDGFDIIQAKQDEEKISQDKVIIEHYAKFGEQDISGLNYYKKGQHFRALNSS